ncbi:MAG: LacI family transcriptional regulator [Oscillospiraceae bacterium]|jgi:DNA-binding LacI/PurR family transcriptional regulator|nr:LacI family transcriptional regulator [Oscillospiraceae bacterium]
MGKSVTIREIAEECHVSIATVSRVFNDSGTVSAATRQRVEEAIARRGYTPNALARSLISDQTMTLGVIAPDIANPYFSALFTLIEQAAIQAGYFLVLCNTFYISSSYQQGQRMARTEEEYFEMMLRRKVDGVLVIGGQIDVVEMSQSYRAALTNLARRMPVVVIGRPIPDVPCVFIEKESGGGVITAVNYLASLGHRRIAFAGGEPGITITATRLGAYRDALAALRLPCDEELVCLSDYYAKDGYQAGQVLLARGVDFTAALAINDSVALGLMRALKDHGLSVPQDVSIISCDQFYNSEYLIPRLTGIDQHNELLGKLVIQALLGAVHGTSEPALIKCMPELVVRESCQPPRQAVPREGAAMPNQ